MARQVQSLAHRYGLACEVAPCEYEPNRMDARITGPHGLSLTVDFCGKSWQPDVFVLSWHFDRPGSVKLSPQFPGEVNFFHRRKATQIAHGFDYLLEDLESTFAMIRTGEVFMPESLPAAA